jgi:hypothetical protein
MKYFILRNDKVHGPFSKQQMAAAVKKQKLRKTDLVGKSETGPWQSVDKVLGGQGTDVANPTELTPTAKRSAAANTPAGDWDFSNLPDVPVPSSLQPATPPVQQRAVPVQAPADLTSTDSLQENAGKKTGTAASPKSFLESAAKELEESESKELAEHSAKQKELYIAGGVALACLAIFVPLSYWVGADFWDLFFGNKASMASGVAPPKYSTLSTTRQMEIALKTARELDDLQGEKIALLREQANKLEVINMSKDKDAMLEKIAEYGRFTREQEAELQKKIDKQQEKLSQLSREWTNSEKDEFKRMLATNDIEYFDWIETAMKSNEDAEDLAAPRSGTYVIGGGFATLDLQIEKQSQTKQWLGLQCKIITAELKDWQVRQVGAHAFISKLDAERYLQSRTEKEKATFQVNIPLDGANSTSTTVSAQFSQYLRECPLYYLDQLDNPRAVFEELSLIQQ